MKKTRTQKGQGFVQGAFILMFANFAVKLIGALFKLPLTNMIGEQAMGYFSSAYSLFTTFFIISTAGLPVAISRMVASAHARGDESETQQIFKVGFRIFLILGACGTVFMALLSPWMQNATKQFGLQYSMWALAPTLFFISIISAYRGYFQGLHNMIPTAASQTLEAFFKLIVGLCLAWVAKKLFPDEPWMWAAFAVLGVTIGVVFSFLYLWITKTLTAKTPKTGALNRENRAVRRELISIAIPITLAAVMTNLTSNIDVFTIVPILSSHGLSEDIANTLYGAYTSHAVTLFNLVPSLTQAFAISIIPAVSAARAKADEALASRTVGSAIKIVSCIVFPAAFGMIALSTPIVDLLFGTDPITYVISSGELKGTLQTLTNAAGDVMKNSDVSAPLLALLSVSIILAGLYACTASILQACGHEKKSILAAVTGILTKLISAWLLISIPEIGILGAPISTGLCYLVMLVLNFFFLSRYAGYAPKFSEFFLRPMLAASLCAATAFGLYTGLHTMGHTTLALAAAILAAVFVYFVTLLLIQGLKRDDILMLPKGAAIAALLTKFKLLK